MFNDLLTICKELTERLVPTSVPFRCARGRHTIGKLLGILCTIKAWINSSNAFFSPRGIETFGSFLRRAVALSAGKKKVLSFHDTKKPVYGSDG